MQRTSQSNIWLFAGALFALAGILGVAFTEGATMAIVFFAIAGLFIVLAFTQGGRRIS
jgi:hypothetical protein